MTNHRLTLGEFILTVYETAAQHYPEHAATAPAKVVSTALRRGILRFDRPGYVRRLMRRLA